MRDTHLCWTGAIDCVRRDGIGLNGGVFACVGLIGTCRKNKGAGGDAGGTLNLNSSTEKKKKKKEGGGGGCLLF